MVRINRNPLLRKVGNAGSLYEVGGRNIFAPLDEDARTLFGGFSPLSLSPALWLKADAGLVTDGAANFVAASSQSLTRASNSTLQIGGSDATFAFWVYPDVLAGDMVSKWLNGEYVVRISGNDVVVTLTTTGDGAKNVGTVPLAIGAWQFVTVQIDNTAKTVTTRVNLGAASPGTFTGTVVNGVDTFCIGARGAASEFYDGKLDSVGLWKRLLSSDELTALYNSGNGVQFSDLTAAQKANLSLWCDFRTSGTLTTDSSGNGNTLTNNNAVTWTAGIASGAATQDGDPVSIWQDQSGNGRHATQATGAARPTLKLAQQNGLPAIRDDDVDDELNFTLPALTNFTIFLAIKLRSVVAGAHYVIGGSAQGLIMGGSAVNGYGAFDGNLRTANEEPVTWGINTFQNAKLWRNGTEATYADTGTLTGLTVARLFCRTDITTLRGNSDIGEFIVYSSLLSDANRQLVESYLRARWGTP